MNLVVVEESQHLGGKFFYYQNLIDGLSNSDLHISILQNKKNLPDNLKKAWVKLFDKLCILQYPLKCIEIDCKNFCREISLLSRQVNPDLIHIQHPIHAYYISHSVWKDVPIIQTVHSFWLNEIDSKKISKEYYLKIKEIQSFAYKYIDHFIALNNTQRQELIKKGVHPNKITIIENSVDGLKVNKEASQSTFYHDDQYISIICRLSPEKGVDIALRALAQIPEDYRPILIIAGDGPEKVNLERLSDALEISNKVIFLGPLSHTDALGVVKGSSLSLCPSVNVNGIEDSAPLSVLESIELSIPVAASKIGGIPDYIVDRINGYLFEPGDYQSLSRIILNHIQNDSRGQNMNTNTHSEMKKFMSKPPNNEKYQAWIDKKINTYNQLINNNKRLF